MINQLPIAKAVKPLGGRVVDLAREQAPLVGGNEQWLTLMFGDLLSRHEYVVVGLPLSADVHLAREAIKSACEVQPSEIEETSPLTETWHGMTFNDSDSCHPEEIRATTEQLYTAKPSWGERAINFIERLVGKG